MKHVLLNHHNLAVANLIDKQESRYTLNAMQVTEKETVVTNGHYLVRVDTPKQELASYPNVAGEPEATEVGSFLLGSDGALALAKVTPKKESIPILNHAKVGVDADGNIRAVTTDLATTHPMTIRKVTGQFPQWEMLFKRTQPKMRIGLSAAYLEQLAKSAKVYEQSNYVELSIWSPQEAVRLDAFDSATNQHWTAILMPMRGGDIQNRPYPFDEVASVPDPFAEVPEPSEVAGAVPEDSAVAV